MFFRKIRAVLHKFAKPENFYYEIYANIKGQDIVIISKEFVVRCYVQEIQKGAELISSNSGGDYTQMDVKVYSSTPIEVSPIPEETYQKTYLRRNNHRFLLSKAKNLEKGLYFLYYGTYAGLFSEEIK